MVGRSRCSRGDIDEVAADSTVILRSPTSSGNGVGRASAVETSQANETVCSEITVVGDSSTGKLQRVPGLVVFLFLDLVYVLSLGRGFYA